MEIAHQEKTHRKHILDDGDKGEESSQPSQASYITVPPSEVVHQPASHAAADVARRPVPREGLVMYDLRGLYR
jgi:hypothetical protein